MNYSDITVGIVSFKSEKVIFRCLKSIKKLKKIIILIIRMIINLKKNKSYLPKNKIYSIKKI